MKIPHQLFLIAELINMKIHERPSIISNKMILYSIFFILRLHNRSSSNMPTWYPTIGFFDYFCIYDLSYKVPYMIERVEECYWGHDMLIMEVLHSIHWTLLVF
jgi:hypothetical protein